MNQTDEQLKTILNRTGVVAVVGLSPNSARPSYDVGRYLGLNGMRVIPINPGHAGKEILGEKVYASLADIPADIQVDMVDIFRKPEHVPPIVDEALETLPNLTTIWMQLGVVHEAAAAKARAAGVDVVMDRCTKQEHRRLVSDQRPG